MKKFTKVISLLLVFAMVACFAACGATTENETTASADKGNEAAKVVKTIDIDLTSEQYAFGVDKNQPELLDKVNAFIKKIKEDGTFDAICDKYFANGEPTAVKSAEEDSSKEQLIIATNAEFAPFDYKQGDSFYGIDMEIASLLAKELGLELVIKDMAFDSVCLSVGEHKCDIAMAGLTINEERKASVTFTDSYYEASQRLIVKSDDTTFDSCKTKEDVEKILNALDKKTIVGYQNGNTAQYYVLGDEGWDFAGLKAEGKGYSSAALATQDLINGGIDIVMVDAAPAKSIAESYNKNA